MTSVAIVRLTFTRKMLNVEPFLVNSAVPYYCIGTDKHFSVLFFPSAVTLALKQKL